MGGSWSGCGGGRGGKEGGREGRRKGGSGAALSGAPREEGKEDGGAGFPSPSQRENGEIDTKLLGRRSAAPRAGHIDQFLEGGGEESGPGNSRSALRWSPQRARGAGEVDPRAGMPSSLRGRVAALGAGRAPAPSSLLAWLPAPPGGGRACPPALLAPSPRLSEEMAGPLGRGTRAAAPRGCRGALRSVRSGSSWDSAGKRSDSSGGAEGTAPGLLRSCALPRRGSPGWIRAAGPVGTSSGASEPGAPRPASGGRLALPAEARRLQRSGREAGVAGPGAARRGRRSGGGEARRRAAAAAATLLPPGLLLSSLARLLARAVRVQPAALRTRAHGARSRTRPRREAPRWVLKRPDSAPPSQPGSKPGLPQPRRWGRPPKAALHVPGGGGEPPTFRPRGALLTGQGL